MMGGGTLPTPTGIIDAFFSVITGLGTSAVAAELARLVTEPPTAAEVAEARQHRLGRYVSAAQSNDELATRLATEWLWYGELLTRDALAARLDAVTEADVAAAARDFAAGTVVTVAHEPDPP